MAVSDIPFSSPIPAGLRGISFVVNGVILELDGPGVGVVKERVGRHVHVTEDVYKTNWANYIVHMHMHATMTRVLE